MRNLPKASDLNGDTEEKQPKQQLKNQPKERPAKSVMKAIGKSVLNPKKTKPKAKSKKPVEGSPQEEAMESKDFESQEQ